MRYVLNRCCCCYSATPSTIVTTTKTTAATTITASTASTAAATASTASCYRLSLLIELQTPKPRTRRAQYDMVIASGSVVFGAKSAKLYAFNSGGVTGIPEYDQQSPLERPPSAKGEHMGVRTVFWGPYNKDFSI